MSDAGSPLPDFETGFTPWDEYSSFFEPILLLTEPGLDLPVDFLLSPDGSSSGSGLTCYHAGLDTSPEGPNRDCPTPDPDGSSSGSDPTRYHAGLDTPSDGLSPEINSPSSGKPLPGSDDPVEEQTRPVSIMEERKRKRKQSNRESARRSRMRKRTELENIRGEVNRLKIENRQLGNQLRFVNHHLQTARMDNNRLRVESHLLQTKLTQIEQFLHFQAIHQSYAYLQ